jgi:3-dehydrosphinganine reductase
MARNDGAFLRDRHVIVTGGSSGIGLAFVRRVTGAGAKVSVVALDDRDMAALREGPPTGPQPVHLAPADVAEPEQVNAAIASCLERHGPADVLLTCAGIIEPGYFMDLPEAELERHMRVNYFGTLWSVRSVLPSMMERRAGSVVMMSSFAALVGVFGYGAYGPTKYAIRGLFETLRVEMRPYGVHVAAVFPTDVDTPQLAHEVPRQSPEQKAMQGKIKPMTPEVVVDAILEGIARRRPRIYPGSWNWLLARLANGAPWLADRIADRAVAKAVARRAQAER